MDDILKYLNRMKPVIKIKRVYEAPSKKDGYRILADRLWPRGLTNAKTHIEGWAKSLAPSVKLRRWFGHDPELWIEFQKQYKAELKKNKTVATFIEEHQNKKIITLVYAAKDSEHTHALILKQYLEQQYAER